MSPARSRQPELRVLPGDKSSGATLPSEEELVTGLLAGDERIAQHLYNRLHPTVDRTLCRVMGRRDADHADLVQTTFEQIVRSIATHRFARACSLNTWASAIAGRVGLKAIRSRSRERKVLSISSEAAEMANRAAPGDVERTASARQDLAVVRRCLGQLRPEKAEAVLLHDVLGHDLVEVASTTGVSVSAAQSRLFRGRKELDRLLEKALRHSEPPARKGKSE